MTTTLESPRDTTPFPWAGTATESWTYEERSVGWPAGLESHFCALEHGEETECTFPHPPPVPKDDLYLMRLAAVPEFRPAYEALSEVCVYRFDPEAIRELREPEQGLLRADGRNVASVLEAIKRQSPATKERLDRYLHAVVPNVATVDKLALGPWRTLAFRKVVREGTRYRRFLARDMSDGTLRIVGMLAALLQGAGANVSRHGLVCIEEPETALHPSALEVLWDMLADGAERTQVLVASQSADLLDHKQVQVDSIVATASDEGGARLGPVDEAGRSVIENGNFTAGELMRMGQLLPDEDALRLRPSQSVVVRRSGFPMTLDVAVVVEGKGKTVAVPVLLRRIAGAAMPGINLRISVLRDLPVSCGPVTFKAGMPAVVPQYVTG